jgi:S-formylglutathione hydrolase FrmB
MDHVAFPGLGAKAPCRQVFIISAFLLGLMALIAAPGLQAGIRIYDSALAENRAADTPEHIPDLAAPLSSGSASVPEDPHTKGFESACGNCRIERRESFSEARAARIAYYAFVPRGSKEVARYPVLYLLHGAFDGCTAWKDHAEKEICDLVSEHRIIIITPEGGSFGWYADSRVVKNNQIETYFLNELIPDVEKNFPTNGLRGIAGLSMGGHGAFVLCLRNPGVFSSVSSMSGILDITLHKNQWSLAKIFGPYKGEYIADWERHSALRLIERSANTIRSLPMLITVSESDQYAIADNRLVHKQLEKMKAEHLYYESPGGHDWAYWTSQLPLHVSFHARRLCELAKIERRQTLQRQ